MQLPQTFKISLVFGISLFSPDVRLFLSLDNPKNAHINGDTEQFGADEVDSLVLSILLLFWKICR